MIIPTNENASGQAGVGIEGLAAKSTLLNAGLHYEPISSLVQANLDGQRAAATILQDIKADCADPDAAYLAIKSMVPDCSDTQVLATLRGFCRALQKQIERGVAE